jgi:hypothetical protein
MQLMNARLKDRLLIFQWLLVHNQLCSSIIVGCCSVFWEHSCPQILAWNGQLISACKMHIFVWHSCTAVYLEGRQKRALPTWFLKANNSCTVWLLRWSWNNCSRKRMQQQKDEVWPFINELYCHKFSNKEMQSKECNDLPNRLQFET